MVFYFKIKIAKIMAKKKLPKSLRKYLRKEKARIRREIFDLKKQKEEIEKLYQKIKTKS